MYLKQNRRRVFRCLFSGICPEPQSKHVHCTSHENWSGTRGQWQPDQGYRGEHLSAAKKMSEPYRRELFVCVLKEKLNLYVFPSFCLLLPSPVLKAVFDVAQRLSFSRGDRPDRLPSLISLQHIALASPERQAVKMTIANKARVMSYSSSEYI